MTTLLHIENVSRRYQLPRQDLFKPAPALNALDDVSIEIQHGETLGIVGESGSGKSTLAHLIAGLDAPTSGSLKWQIERAPGDVQMVFQDPYGSLDPRWPVGRIVAEPLHRDRLTQSERDDRINTALREVGLDPGAASRFPHQFSGGQRQRIAIARALIARPALVIADEPVSALDVSIQAQILNLLNDLKARHELTYLLISHDLAVIAHLADRTAVLEHGRLVELGETGEVLNRPQSPATKALMRAVLPPDPKRARERLAEHTGGTA